jgi:hypothetical protein
MTGSTCDNCTMYGGLNFISVLRSVRLIFVVRLCGLL